MTENKNSLFAGNDNNNEPDLDQNQQKEDDRAGKQDDFDPGKDWDDDLNLDEELNFEEALEDLEEIVQELEGDVLSLQESMEKFSRGMKLIRFCQQELNRAEGRIEQVLEKHGELQEIIPFEINED